MSFLYRPCGALQTATDYGPYIQNLPSPLHTTSIVEACTQLLVDQWHYLRANVRSTVHAWRTAFPCVVCDTPLTRLVVSPTLRA